MNFTTGQLSSSSNSSSIVESLPYTELLQVHRCLRQELNELHLRVLRLCQSVGNQEAWNVALASLLNQFDFFFVVYHAHSSAEDEILLPALKRKGLDPEAEEELRQDHCGHSRHFDGVRVLLLKLRSLDTGSADLGGTLQQLNEQVDSVKASVALHFKKEEEELFPLLTKHFESEEVNVLAAHILGNRSSYLVNCYLQMITRDLSPHDRVQAINSIKEAAKNTRFSSWLEHITLTENKKTCFVPIAKRTDLPGAIINQHSCSQPGTCCHSEEQQSYGCSHYKRGCKLLFPCCDELFSCRLCHDEAIAERSVVGGGGVKFHQADRHSIKQMWCMKCQHLQPVAGKCANCQTTMSKYFCDVCNLFDDSDSAEVYHCPFCNVCRRGKGLGVDLYHCMRCNACISSELKDHHQCRDNSLDVDCAICLQGLFDTTEPVQHMQCGHFLHRKCYNQYITTSFQCPMCKKCACDMSNVWAKFDGIWRHLFEQNGASLTSINIHCNECQKNGMVQMIGNLPDSCNSLPNKCPSCGSYNTERLS